MTYRAWHQERVSPGGSLAWWWGHSMVMDPVRQRAYIVWTAGKVLLIEGEANTPTLIDLVGPPGSSVVDAGVVNIALNRVTGRAYVTMNLYVWGGGDGPPIFVTPFVVVISGSEVLDVVAPAELSGAWGSGGEGCGEASVHEPTDVTYVQLPTSGRYLAIDSGNGYDLVGSAPDGRADLPPRDVINPAAAAPWLPELTLADPGLSPGATYMLRPAYLNPNNVTYADAHIPALQIWGGDMAPWYKYQLGVDTTTHKLYLPVAEQDGSSYVLVLAPGPEALLAVSPTPTPGLRTFTLDASASTPGTAPIASYQFFDERTWIWGTRVALAPAGPASVATFTLDVVSRYPGATLDLHTVSVVVTDAAGQASKEAVNLRIPLPTAGPRLRQVASSNASIRQPRPSPLRVSGRGI